jgi:hypothetical protein
MFLEALLKETKAPTKYRKPDIHSSLFYLVPSTPKHQLNKTQSQSAQHSPDFHIKSDSGTYPSTVLHTGTRNKAWHTARESLTDMLFLFLSKKGTKGQEKAYLLSSRKRIKQTREQQQKEDAQRSHWEVKLSRKSKIKYQELKMILS